MENSKINTITVSSFPALSISDVYVAISRLLVSQFIIINPHAYFYVLASQIPERFSKHARKCNLLYVVELDIL